MKKILYRYKRIISICCTVAILIAGVGIHNVMAQFVSGSVKGTPANTFEKVLKRDGYIHGINYPWLPGYGGHSLTGNAENYTNCHDQDYSLVGIDEYTEKKIYEDFINMKALGFNSIAYWGSMSAEGVIFDQYGNVTGAKSDYLANVRRFLEIAKKADVTLLWIVHAHAETVGKAPEMNASRERWDIISQMYCNYEKTEQYIKNFVTPLLKVLADYQDQLLLISAGSEAENEINDSSISPVAMDLGVTKGAMTHFLRRINETCAEKLPNVARTLVCNTYDIQNYNDFDLSVVGRNYYGNSLPQIESFRTVHPMIVSEIGRGKFVTEDQFLIDNMSLLTTAKEYGYNGAFWWKYEPLIGKGGSNESIFNSNTTSTHDWRPLAYAIHNYITDCIKEYKGTENELDKAAVLYNNGRGNVYWITARDAVKYDIQVSYNGGEWKTVATSVKDSDTDYVKDNMGEFADKNLQYGKTSRYRVISYAEDGRISYSEPSNEAAVNEPAPNLLVNGSFEDGLNGWTLRGAVDVKVEEAEDAPDGNHAIKFHGGDNGWHRMVQYINIEPNTDYEVELYYKKIPEYTKGTAYCYLHFGEEYEFKSMDMLGGNIEWAPLTYTFNSGSNSVLQVDVCHVPNHPPLYIDNISVRAVS